MLVTAATGSGERKRLETHGGFTLQYGCDRQRANLSGVPLAHLSPFSLAETHPRRFTCNRASSLLAPETQGLVRFPPS